jgi:TM2 domain-containing membrane protein YozV
MAPANISEKSRLVTLLLCWFLGLFGVHRFYVGKTGTGILQLLTLGGLGIWALIDFVMIIVGSFTDADGAVVFQWTEPGA